MTTLRTPAARGARGWPSLLIAITAATSTAPGCSRPNPASLAADAVVAASPGAERSDRVETRPPPAGPAEDDGALALDAIAIPDVPLTDQEGRPVDLVRDRIGDRVAAIQVMFTRCSTACPLLGGKFRGVQEILGDRVGTEFALISVTVDPAHDRPAVLKAWADRFGARPGWSLVTGSKPDVDRLLRGIGAATPAVQDHSSQVLVYDGATGKGVRASGLAEPAVLASLMKRVRDARPEPSSVPTTADDSPSRRYFTDTVLVDQHGRPRRFYGDLLRGKVVVINVFFSGCKGSCPVMEDTLARLQDRLGDRLERDVRLISITVDSGKDTSEVLADHARTRGARPGWYFLTGDKSSVDLVLRKLGQYVETPEAHGSLMLVGNLRTGLWKKVLGLAGSEGVIAQVESILADDGD